MTREDAEDIYDAGRETVIRLVLDLCEVIDSSKQRIEELEKKVASLSKNSGNSSKPPSSDITKARKKKKKDKKKSSRKRGAQPGHPKHERAAFAPEKINFSRDYVLAQCPDCNGEVELIDGAPMVTQQVELKEDIVTREEHRSYPVWCEKCQKVHYMPFPPEVFKAGLFKERITALAAYMKNVCHCSFSTIRKFIRDVMGEKISRGQLRKLIEKVSSALDAPYKQLLGLLPYEDKLNVDETGHKENGERFWTWVFRADLYVLFKIDKSRGSKVLIDVLGEEFKGVLGCDYFSAYRKYMKDFDITVQFCIAHLIRDVKFLCTLSDSETKQYGKNLLKAIREMFHVIHAYDEMRPDDFNQALTEARDHILTIGIGDAPSKLGKDGKEQKREAQNMAKRFGLHGNAYFEFITTPRIEPTNNLAEQAIRFVVIDRHITQGTRSIKGRKSCEKLWTVIATCSLQGRSAYEFIVKAVLAYFRDQTAPSLLPGET